MIEDALELVGTIIAEKYRVERIVGEGGFAVVYRAEHLLWKRPVAIKVFKALANLTADLREQLTQDFIREGALLADLSEKSASICQARDVGVLTTHTGLSVPFMVLEWLEGEPLEDAIQREREAGTPPRSLTDTLRLLDPIAEALALAHARGIAHRDVKPANIFLVGGANDERGAVKLLDFGIAKVVQDMQKAGGAFSQTGEGVRSFTPAYAAPEQFSRTHGSTGPWTDVFALALVAVELLTGNPPLEGESFLQLGFAAGDVTLRPTPRERGAVVSDAVEAVFARALAVARLDRYGSADAFWRELRAAAAGTTPAGPMSTASPQSTAIVPSFRQGVPSQPRADAHAVTALEPPPPPPLAPGSVVAPATPTPGWVFALGGGLALGVGVLAAFFFFPAKHPMAERDPRPTAAGSASTLMPPLSAPTPSASAAPHAPCAEGMTLIPGGPFFMGADDGTPPEKPAHKVKLAPYCMDIHEVTTERYVACSDSGWCKRASMTNTDDGLGSDREAYDLVCNLRDPVARAKHPINCVTWEMADVFCRSAKLRLPTEAEWEFAARGSDGRTYPWGDEPPSATRLNACGKECQAWGAAAKVAPLPPMYDSDDHWPNTAPVGSFPEGKSKFGVLDLAGNVWEWVSDWYGPYAAGDGVNPLEDPKGPVTGTRKVIRGGAWNGSEASWERPSFRYWKDPADRNYGVGFRCAADPQ